MAKKQGDGAGAVIGVVCVAGGLLLLDYLSKGRGEENNAILVPDSIEDRVDSLVSVLNEKIGKRWVNYTFDFLQARLKQTLPPQLVALLGVVYAVEQMSRAQERAWGVRMTGPQKKHKATEQIAASVAYGWLPGMK